MAAGKACCDTGGNRPRCEKSDVYTTSAMHVTRMNGQWQNIEKSICGRQLSVCSGLSQINECLGNTEGLLLAPFHQ